MLMSLVSLRCGYFSSHKRTLIANGFQQNSSVFPAPNEIKTVPLLGWPLD